MNPNSNSSGSPPPPPPPTPTPPPTPAPVSHLNEGLRDMANEPAQPGKAFSTMPDPFTRIEEGSNNQQLQQPNAHAQSTLSGHSTQNIPVSTPTSTQTLEQLNNLTNQQKAQPQFEQQTVQNQPLAQVNSDPSAMNPSKYLDSIAAKPPPEKFFSGKMLFMAIGAGVFLIFFIILGVTFSGRQPASLTNGVALGNSLANLQALLDYREVRSLNADTRKITAEARLITISNRNALARVATLADPNLPSTPDTNRITEDLDAARANGRLNPEFIEKLSSNIITIRTHLNNLYQTVDTDAARSTIRQALSDFEELKSRIP